MLPSTVTLTMPPPARASTVTAFMDAGAAARFFCLCCPRAGPGTGFHPRARLGPRSVRARPKARCPRNGAGECHTGEELVCGDARLR